MKVKALTIFDLKNIIENANDSTLKYVYQYNIINKTDITNLFIHFAFTNIIKLYQSTKGLIAFYFSLDLKEKMENAECEINYKKFLKIITKKLKFPIVLSNLSFEYFIKLLKDESPEYDEIIQDFKMMSEIYPKLVDTIKKLKFYKLEKDVVNDIKEQIKLICAFV